MAQEADAAQLRALVVRKQEDLVVRPGAYLGDLWCVSTQEEANAPLKVGARHTAAGTARAWSCEEGAGHPRLLPLDVGAKDRDGSNVWRSEGIDLDAVPVLTQDGVQPLVVEAGEGLQAGDALCLKHRGCMREHVSHLPLGIGCTVPVEVTSHVVADAVEHPHHARGAEGGAVQIPVAELLGLVAISVSHTVTLLRPCAMKAAFGGFVVMHCCVQLCGRNEKVQVNFTISILHIA